MIFATLPPIQTHTTPPQPTTHKTALWPALDNKQSFLGMNVKLMKSSVQGFFLKMLKIWDNWVHAGFYSCLVIFLTAVIIQEILPQKQTEQQNISPLSLRLSLWGSPWIFLLLTGSFPSLTCCSFTGICKSRTFFPTSYHIFYFGGRILALLSEH